MLNEIFRNRKIFNKYIKNFDLDAVELVGTGMTSVEALKAVVFLQTHSPQFNAPIKYFSSLPNTKKALANM